MNKLLLCAGHERWPDYLTLDANPDAHCDITAAVPPLPLAVLERQWDEVALIHGIEHFYLWDAEKLMRAVLRVLAPDGVFVLEQPNIEVAARVLMTSVVPEGLPATDTLDRFGMYVLYGEPTYRDPLMVHKWGWTPKTLEKALRAAGFTRVEEQRAQHHYPGRDFRMEARP